VNGLFIYVLKKIYILLNNLKIVIKQFKNIIKTKIKMSTENKLIKTIDNP